LRKGWLIFDGQDGDRTVEEQTAALFPAIQSCAGKTILDLGAAEGLISREFVRAGAASSVCIEAVQGHIIAGREQCAGLPIQFLHRNLNEIKSIDGAPFDIVLCLGIAHKLREPSHCINLAAKSSRDMVLIRSGRGADSRGVIKSKYWPNTCDSHAVMQSHGFMLERVVEGPPPHSEPVEYWRRT